MFVKLFDNTPNIAKMPDEEAIRAGYKLAVFSEKPTAPDGYHASSYWTEEEETCTQHWEIVKDDDPTPTVEDKAEAFDILTGVTK